MRSSRRSRPCRRPSAEALEARACPSLTVQMDYSHDANGFFADQTRRDLLQLAADTIASRLGDHLAAIEPGGGDSWTAVFQDPSSGALASLADPTIPADTILVFAGGRSLGMTEVGEGGPGGLSASGTRDWLDLVSARGQAGALTDTRTDFGPWGGSISFDTAASWSFGLAPPSPGSARNDFLSVALHEMSHLLGFGSAGSWFDQVADGRFLGANARAASDTGAAPLVSADGSHWFDGTTDHGAETAMDPVLLTGTRKLLTALDFAALDDLGWDVITPETATLGTAEDLGFAAGIGPAASGSLIGGGVLTSGTDTDLYRFSAEAGVTVSFRADGAFTPSLRLFDASGAELAPPSAGSLAFSIAATGTYYLGVSGPLNLGYSSTDPLAGLLGGPSGAYELTYATDGGGGGDVGGGGGGGAGEIVPVAVADLALDVSGPASAEIGAALEYTITVANRGGADAEGVNLTIPLPAGATFLGVGPSEGSPFLIGSNLAFGFGTIAANTSATARFSIATSEAGPLTLTASVQGVGADPSPSNNADAVATVVARPAPVPAPVGDRVAPTVVSVRRVTLRKGRKKSSAIVVTFSEGLDAGSAAGLSAYRLTRQGPRRGGKATRVNVRLKAASFDGRDAVTLTPAGNKPLPKGLQLRIDGLLDAAGNRLDGDRDGEAGGAADLAIR